MALLQRNGNKTGAKRTTGQKGCNGVEGDPETSHYGGRIQTRARQGPNGNVSNEAREEGSEPLYEVIEDTLDWVAHRCGLHVTARPPRPVRRAVRHLDSVKSSARHRAEVCLLAHQPHATPLLRSTARARLPYARAVRAALLLHRLDPQEGREMLRHLAHEQHLLPDGEKTLLRQALRDLVGSDAYVRQVASALARLEQNPIAFAAIGRLIHALETLRFLEQPLPADLTRRLLTLRITGGEDLRLIRAAFHAPDDVLTEHVCVARFCGVRLVLQTETGEQAYGLLRDALAHPSLAVKLTALWGLERLGDLRVLPLIQQLAAEPLSPIAGDAQRVADALRPSPDSWHDTVALLRPTPYAAEPADQLLRSTRRPAPNPATLLRAAPAPVPTPPAPSSAPRTPPH